MLHDVTFNGIYNVMSELFDATDKQMTIWIESNTKYFQKIDPWYKDVKLDSSEFVYLDTEDREYVLDVIALVFLKERWPRYRDGKQAYIDFMDDLSSAVYRYGWKLRDGVIQS